jgi:hypothetical protein
MRIITQREGRFFTQLREFTHSEASLSRQVQEVDDRASRHNACEVLSAERRSITKLLVFEYATMREDGKME